MKFYFYPTHGGERRELTEDEVREHLSAAQIEEAVEAKRADPLEQVSYMSEGGFIHCEYSE